MEENGAEGDLSSEGSPLTDTGRPGYLHKRITVAGQRRNLTGLRSLSEPGIEPGAWPKHSDEGRQLLSSIPCLGSLRSMNKFVPVLITAAVAVVAVAAVRLLEDDPMPTQPDGVWELDEDTAAS